MSLDNKKVIPKESNLKENNNIALLGFIFSLTVCLALPGLILSIVGLCTSKDYKNNRKGLAIAGISISAFIFLFSISLIVNEPKESTSTSSNDKKSYVEKKKKQVEVTDFSTISKDEASSWCDNNNLKCNIKEDYSDEVEAGKLISQSVEKGSKVDEDSEINVVYSLGHKKTAEEIENEFKSGCQSVDYRDVLRNHSSYGGQKVYWFGKIQQAVGGNSYMVYVNCEENQFSDGGYLCHDPIYITYIGTENLIENDIIEIWGYASEKAYTYTTVLGASKTIPQFTAVYVSIK